MVSDAPVVGSRGLPALPAGVWIESPRFDLAFPALAPLLKAPIIAAGLLDVPYLPLLGFLLGFAHYFSTLSFFLWDENRPYHRARWAAFYGGPVLIVLVYTTVWASGIPYAIELVVFFWTVFHVSRQSSGLVSLYRQRSGVNSPAERRTAGAAILSMGLWLSLWNIDTHPGVMPLFDLVAPGFATFLWLVAGATALVWVGRLLVQLSRRPGILSPRSRPELLMLFTSLTLFHPFLWVPTSAGATFVMLLPHYLQYLAIVWLLHRRKFPRREGSGIQRALIYVSGSTPRLVATLAAVTLAVTAAKILGHRMGDEAPFEFFYLLVALLHYYADGLVWAFRDPHVRQSMGPYLTGSLARSA